MNTKKMTAFIVGAMLIATVLVMAVSAAGMDRKEYANDPRMVYEFDAADNTGIYINDMGENEPMLRIYGEEGAIYPTHTLTNTLDFIYPDAVDPFDPGVIAKDSVTFNPAYIENTYDGKEITVDGSNGDEKVFLRTFYEPGYGHGIDEKMNEPGHGTNPVFMSDGALVLETTYMLLMDNGADKCQSGLPKAGAAKDVHGNIITYFMLPTHSSNFNDEIGGMDVAKSVDLNYASGMGTPDLTDGEIEVQREVTLKEGGAVKFMDHRIKFKTPTHPNYAITLDIQYTGNMEFVEDRKNTETVNQGQTYHVDRLNNLHPATDPDYRFYFTVDRMYKDPSGNYKVDMTVGRHLAAGETFYVDGVRYDMPAIYVTDENKFKYITFQTPLPKCDGEVWYSYPSHETNQADKSHVTCQWLANLLEYNTVWVLPPFNDGHLMIDDIDLDEYKCTGGITVDQTGEMIGTVNELVFYYIDEAIEDRFDSNLAERHARKDGVQIWNWWNIYTKPYAYTELVLPDQEYDGMTYLCGGNVDGNEYLVTTSFIAPNSEGDDRHADCKTDDTHDIIDRVATIGAVVGDTSRDDCAGMPRMVFEYDASATDDLFVNDDGTGNATVRVYGEAGAIYPTHTLKDTLDFIYPDAVDPFDPGVIAKDSVTFNPAYIENTYDNREITVDGSNGDEKVFLRTFYEPGYGHGIDEKMNEPGHGTNPVFMSDGALVLETTYMLLHDNGADECQSGLPKAGAAKDVHGNIITYFMLPTHSSNFNDKIGGMDVAKSVDLNYASGMGTADLTDGEIEVQREVTLKEGDAVKFMDHRIKFKTPTHPNYAITLDIQYTGNMEFVEDRKNTETVNQGQTYHVDRLNNLHPATDPDYRFYFTVDRMYKDPSGNYKVDMTVGRHLAAGETFYVDGVRYDMPAIYVTDEDKFKYITFQTPLPKCDGEVWYSYPSHETNQADKSHVTCQWLANLLEDHTVWVLPPFNDGHLMIDDIDLKEYTCTGGITVDQAGEMIGTVDELVFYYIDEATEGRFNSSLAERHYVENGIEEWDWWNIYTKPYAYTELVLPDQEEDGDRYLCGGNVDGNEYIVTTSFIAPNCEEDDRTADCKPYDTHDIIDRPTELLDPVGTECKGDFDGDGDRDLDDFMDFVDAYGTSSSDPLYDSAGDFDDDGNIDLDDFMDFVDAYGVPCP